MRRDFDEVVVTLLQRMIKLKSLAQSVQLLHVILLIARYIFFLKISIIIFLATGLRMWWQEANPRFCVYYTLLWEDIMCSGYYYVNQ